MTSSAYQKHVNDPQNRIFRCLSKAADGDQTNGNINANGNYSSAPTYFFIKPPTGQIYSLERMLVQLRDTGTIDSGSYGNGITLTNGIICYVKSDIVPEQSITTVPIKTNPDWGIYCYDVQVSSYGLGDETLNVRWTFSKSGRPLELNGDCGQEFGVKLNDDLSGLVSQYFQVQGIIIKKVF